MLSNQKVNAYLKEIANACGIKKEIIQPAGNTQRSIPWNVEDNVGKESFIRVHKTYLVSISKIEAIENNEIIIQSFRIPISRNYRDQVIERVVSNKLWKK